MKINELLNEAAPGTELNWLQRLIKPAKDAKHNFDMNRAVKKAYMYWVDHVQRMQNGGYDMKDPDKYLKELSRWMHVRLHIPRNSKILTDMITYLKTNGTTNQTLPVAMLKALNDAANSPERGNRFATRDPVDMQKLAKAVIPIIDPLISTLDRSRQQDVVNFILAKIVADNTINDPVEIAKLAKDYIANLPPTPGRAPRAPRATRTGTPPAGGSTP